ncbi:drug resistance transporter, EmrB/QacA subfamily [Marinomonas polaris DSM 16579]|uniref:Drug resistance transporter, EmrB/QacA subfamily n=1 Tax=Marinomonas polaris DSM 16579 TaxID=1122206 RepID=A0A1M5CVX8_9GAMM|nr:MFS transporter [Marinomonas polaris]SHF58757.1 drug resistance transporter, EmrB/QacA subfamily [Marinomonas polaris DSM 16579]
MTNTATLQATLADALSEGISEHTFTRRWRILAVLCLSLMTVMIANMSLNLALPELALALNMTQLQMTWSIEAYTLIFAALLFVASAIADRYGRKLAMQIGLAVFALASLYAAFIARNGSELIAARLVMGIGGAFVMPTTLSIVNLVFPSVERARAIAIWSAVSGVGMMFGSIITGTLLEFFSWHSTFIFGAILAAFSLVFNYILVPETRDELKNPVDWVGDTLITVALVGIVYAIIEAPSMGVSNIWVTTGLVLGTISLIGFVWQQLRSSSPLLDVRLFLRPEFGLSALAVTLTFFAMMGAFYGMSQIFQLVMGYGTFMSSIAFFPVMLPMMVLSPMVPKIVDRIGTKWTVAPGLMLIAAGFLFMSQWPVEVQYWQFLVGMGTVTIGMTFVMTPATNMMMAAVPKNRSGMGSAINDTTRELGGALGIAVLGSMISSGFSTHIAKAPAVLPEALRTTAESSLAAALSVAQELGIQSVVFTEQARAAFMSGTSDAMFVSFIIALAAAALIGVFLPNRSTPEARSEAI